MEALIDAVRHKHGIAFKLICSSFMQFLKNDCVSRHTFLNSILIFLYNSTLGTNHLLALNMSDVTKFI